MKRLIALVLTVFLTFGSAFADTDRFSKENLQSGTHFSPLKPFAEKIVKKSIKSALKKQTGSNFDVSFEGYDAPSIKKGIFKSIEITGKDVKLDEVIIPYVRLKSLTDYNYIDYTKKPIAFKSDMTYAYDLLLTDDAINKALQDSDYKKVLTKVNKLSGPLFTIKTVKTKIVNNKMYIIMDYNFPIVKTKDKSFVVSSDFQASCGKINAKNVHLDSIYGNVGIDKVTNLINLLNPLEFTMNLLDDNKHKVNIENINIVDNKVKVDGKIFVKGE